jgi:hypothetical protein
MYGHIRAVFASSLLLVTVLDMQPCATQASQAASRATPTRNGQLCTITDHIIGHTTLAIVELFGKVLIISGALDCSLLLWPHATAAAVKYGAPYFTKSRATCG